MVDVKGERVAICTINGHKCRCSFDKCAYQRHVDKVTEESLQISKEELIEYLYNKRDAK